MRRPLHNNQSGFSLTEAVVAALILSVMGLAIATSTTMGHRLGVEENRKVTASILKDRVQQILESPLAWDKTVAQASNKFMQDCLEDIDACPNGARLVSMFDEFGDQISDANNSGFGFSHSLEVCNSFSAEGSDSCPYSVQVFFEGNPSIKLEAQVLYRPRMVQRSLATETKGPPIYSDEIKQPPQDYEQPGFGGPKNEEALQMKSGGQNTRGENPNASTVSRGDPKSGSGKPAAYAGSPLNENLLRVKVVKSRSSKGMLYECSSQQELIDGICRPRFYGQRCPANQALSGINPDGSLRCRPIVTQTCPEGQALVGYDATTGEITCQTQVGMCDNEVVPPPNRCPVFTQPVPVCFDRNNDGISDPATECRYQRVYLLDGTVVGGDVPTTPTTTSTTAPISSISQCSCPTGFTLNQINPAQPYCEVRRNCPQNVTVEGENIRMFGPFMIEEPGQAPILYCAGCKPGSGDFANSDVVYDKQKNWCYYFSRRGGMSNGINFNTFYEVSMRYSQPQGNGYGQIPLFPPLADIHGIQNPNPYQQLPGIPGCNQPSGSQGGDMTFDDPIVLPANASPNGYMQRVGRYFNEHGNGYVELELLSRTFVNRRSTFYWCSGGSFAYSGGAPGGGGNGPGNFGGGNVGVSPGSP